MKIALQHLPIWDRHRVYRAYYRGITAAERIEFIKTHLHARGMVFKESDGTLLYADYWPDFAPWYLGE
jgi:hypothetical protein